MRIPNDINDIIVKYLINFIQLDLEETKFQHYILEDKYKSYLYENKHDEFDFDNPIIMKFETEIDKIENKIFELEKKINITKLKNID